MATHTITKAIVGAGMNLQRAYGQTVLGAVLIDGEQVADEASDFEIQLPINVSDVLSFFLVSDQDVTIETNDGTTPDDTIELVAGKPYVWDVDDYSAFLLGTDVVSIFVTNNSGATATIYCLAGVDPTPA